MSRSAAAGFVSAAATAPAHAIHAMQAASKCASRQYALSNIARLRLTERKIHGLRIYGAGRLQYVRCRTQIRRHSTLMPAALTIFAHFALVVPILAPAACIANPHRGVENPV